MGGEADREQIRALIYAYSRALDRLDEPLLRSLFHADAELDYGGFQGTATQFCTVALDGLRGLRATQHNMLNCLIHLDGDRAGSETYAMNFHGFHPEAGKLDFVSFIRYVDRLERREGVWKFTRREALMEGRIAFDPAAGAGLDVLSRQPPSGRRDREDRSYSALPASGLLD